MKRFVFLLLSSIVSFAQAQQTNEAILLNQIGFYPTTNKIAVVTKPVSNLN